MTHIQLSIFIFQSEKSFEAGSDECYCDCPKGAKPQCSSMPPGTSMIGNPFPILVSIVCLITAITSLNNRVSPVQIIWGEILKNYFLQPSYQFCVFKSLLFCTSSWCLNRTHFRQFLPSTSFRFVFHEAFNLLIFNDVVLIGWSLVENMQFFDPCRVRSRILRIGETPLLSLVA